MLFPNTTIFFLHDTAQVTSLFPIGPDQCRFSSVMLRKAGAVDTREQERLDFVHKSFWATMEEDHRVCESIQAAARAGDVPDYLLGRMEFLIATFHQALDDALDGSFAAPGVSCNS
jgi:hypothetical protein